MLMFMMILLYIAANADDVDDDDDVDVVATVVNKYCTQVSNPCKFLSPTL